jgi:hypothetical protein
VTEVTERSSRILFGLVFVTCFVPSSAAMIGVVCLMIDGAGMALIGAVRIADRLHIGHVSAGFFAVLSGLALAASGLVALWKGAQLCGVFLLSGRSAVQLERRLWLSTAVWGALPLTLMSIFITAATRSIDLAVITLSGLPLLVPAAHLWWEIFGAPRAQSRRRVVSTRQAGAIVAAIVLVACAAMIAYAYPVSSGIPTTGPIRTR